MTSQWREAKPSYASIPGMDPAVDWVFGEGVDYFYAAGQQRQWLPILVQLKNIGPADFQAGQSFIAPDSLVGWSRSLRVSKLYLGTDPGSGTFPFCTALVTKEFFDLLLSHPKAHQFIARVTLGLPIDRDALPDDAFPHTSATPTPGPP